MTIPYNVTTIGISDKLIENFEPIYIDKDLLDNFLKGDISIDLNQILENERTKKITKRIKLNNDKNKSLLISLIFLLFLST